MGGEGKEKERGEGTEGRTGPHIQPPPRAGSVENASYCTV